MIKKLATLLLMGALLGGQESNQQEGIQDSTEHYSVVYQPLPLNNILTIYDGQDREIPMCQMGYEQNGVRVVTNLILPYVFESTDSMASFNITPCDFPNYLGIIHNHPSEFCIPGEMDMDRFVNDERASIETIVCGTNIENGAVTMSQTIKEDLSDLIIEKYKR